MSKPSPAKNPSTPAAPSAADAASAAGNQSSQVGAGKQPAGGSSPPAGSASESADDKTTPASEAGVSAGPVGSDDLPAAAGTERPYDSPDGGEPRPVELLRLLREQIQRGRADIDLLSAIWRRDLVIEQDVRVHKAAVASEAPSELIHALCVADPSITDVLGARVYGAAIVFVVMSDNRVWKVEVSHEA